MRSACERLLGGGRRGADRALAAAYSQGGFANVDQRGVNVVLVWLRPPESEDEAVIEPCL